MWVCVDIWVEFGGGCGRYMLGCGNQNMVQNSAWFLGKREEREEEITVEDCSIK